MVLMFHLSDLVYRERYWHHLLTKMMMTSLDLDSQTKVVLHNVSSTHIARGLLGLFPVQAEVAH